MAKEWTELKDVPLTAYFRFKGASKNRIYRIGDIDLMFAGGAPMPGLTLKAGPAVFICNQMWRVSELAKVFEVSIDCENWHECTGEIQTGDIDKVLAFATRGLTENSQLSQRIGDQLAQQIAAAKAQQEKSAELEKQVQELKQAHSELLAKMQSAPPVGDKGKPDGKKS